MTATIEDECDYIYLRRSTCRYVIVPVPSSISYNEELIVFVLYSMVHKESGEMALNCTCYVTKF